MNVETFMMLSVASLRYLNRAVLHLIDSVLVIVISACSCYLIALSSIRELGLVSALITTKFFLWDNLLILSNGIEETNRRMLLRFLIIRFLTRALQLFRQRCKVCWSCSHYGKQRRFITTTSVCSATSTMHLVLLNLKHALLCQLYLLVVIFLKRTVLLVIRALNLWALVLSLRVGIGAVLVKSPRAFQHESLFEVSVAWASSTAWILLDIYTVVETERCLLS